MRSSRRRIAGFVAGCHAVSSRSSSIQLTENTLARFSNPWMPCGPWRRRRIVVSSVSSHVSREKESWSLVRARQPSDAHRTRRAMLADSRVPAYSTRKRCCSSQETKHAALRYGLDIRSSSSLDVAPAAVESILLAMRERSNVPYESCDDFKTTTRLSRPAGSPTQSS